MHDTYMLSKTISLPDDVVPIIDSLPAPFSTWVVEQLRRYESAGNGLSLGQQLLADAEFAGSEAPTGAESQSTVDRLERSAPW